MNQPLIQNDIQIPFFSNKNISKEIICLLMLYIAHKIHLKKLIKTSLISVTIGCFFRQILISLCLQVNVSTICICVGISKSISDINKSIFGDVVFYKSP